MNADIVVIGAGTVGSAIAYGLAERDLRILVLDGGDRDFRAANANFGLVWQQGKGTDMPSYQRLTRDSVDAWPSFCAELADATAIDLQYEHNGGLALCFSEAEIEQRRALLSRLDIELGRSVADWEILDRRALASFFPAARLGPDVAGASLGHRDGHANPLNLLVALHAGILRKGGRLLGGRTVHSLQPTGRAGFTLMFGSERVNAGRVVIAAGLGSKALAAAVDLDVPIRPQRGQILVTERLDPLFSLPTMGLRQTRDGTVMIGATHEEAGLDTSTTGDAATALGASAIRCVPDLREVTLVRQWAGLRVLTPDGYPIYAESPSHPGAYVALCHSGVTLAAVHATAIADAIATDRLPASHNSFHHGRFDVSKAA